MPAKQPIEYDDNGLWGAALKELQRQLEPPVKKVKDDNNRTVDRVSLLEFVEATSNLKLEKWQKHLCGILQTLTHTKGRRILIHKPPQHGGSVVVSQRLPAYLIGDDPNHRVKLACYNIEHATVFSGINKSIMCSAAYKVMFPDPALHVSLRAPEKAFRTRERQSYNDGQYSVMALGLLTGFVGQGADTLVIDDPYASPQEADSKATLKSVWQFWSEGAKVRIDEETNVIVMFHRYHEDDFVGQLIKEEGLKSKGGTWELYSYRAEWDGDERLEVGGKDPINRKVGEYLSPRKAAQPGYYPKQRKNLSVWLSQFQGKPSKAEGNMFHVHKMKVIPRVPCALIKVCRSWDVASTEDGGNYTASPLLGLGDDNIIYVLDCIRFRKDTDERNKIMRRTALVDKLKYGDKLVITVPQDPNSAGKDMSKAFVKLLIGFIVKIVSSFNRGDKTTKADPWSTYVNAGLVRLVYSGDLTEKDTLTGEFISWVPDFVEEHRKFPKSSEDDQVDAAADAFAEIALEIDIPAGESFDTLGFSGKEDSIPEPYKEETQDELMAEVLMSRYEEMIDNMDDERSIRYGKNKASSKLSLRTKSERIAAESSKRRCKIRVRSNRD